MTEAIAVLVLAVPMAVALLWIRAMVLLAFLAWFVVPLWPSMPSVPLYAAMGLVLLPQVVKSASPDDKEDRLTGLQRMAKSALESLMTSGMLWLLGAVIVWVAR